MVSEGDVLVHEYQDGEWEVLDVRGSAIRAERNGEIEHISREEYGRPGSVWSRKSETKMNKERIKQEVRDEVQSTEKRFDTEELTEHLKEQGYDAINDRDSVIVDRVDDVNQLFRDVEDYTMGFKLTMVNRPNTVYIDPKQSL